MCYFLLMQTHGYIYGLYDPRTGQLRYIGQTIMTLVRRLQMHMTPSVLARPSHRTYWLKSLREKGLRPDIRELAKGSTKDELDQLEIQFIAEARTRGEALTNLDSGGKSMSLWHRERLRQMKIGVPLSEDTKAKISEAKKGQPSPNKGIPMSAETKAKVSAGRKGQLLGETHHQYRHDISTEHILQRLSEGATKAQIALELGVAHTFVHRRVRQAQTAGQVIPKCKRLLPKREPFSAEHRAKLSAARKGRFQGDQHPGWKDVPIPEILARMDQGLGQQEIAKEFGVSAKTIRQKLRQAGHGPSKIEVPVDQVFQRLAEGATVRAISNELGLPYMSVWRRVQKTKEAA